MRSHAKKPKQRPMQQQAAAPRFCLRCEKPLGTAMPDVRLYDISDPANCRCIYPAPVPELNAERRRRSLRRQYEQIVSQTFAEFKAGRL